MNLVKKLQIVLATLEEIDRLWSKDTPKLKAELNSELYYMYKCATY